METMLTVKEVAELKGCTERYVRILIDNKMVAAETVRLDIQGPGRGGVQYRIPLGALDGKLQLKYRRLRKKQGKAAPMLDIEGLTAAERAEIAHWKSVLDGWRKHRGAAKLRGVPIAAADDAFVAQHNSRHGHAPLTRRTLYRKWKGLRAGGEAALLDRRGKHGGHARKMADEGHDGEESP